MLDFPDLFAPARIVSGAIAIDWRPTIDLYPLTASSVMPEGAYPAKARLRASRRRLAVSSFARGRADFASFSSLIP
jgi:hypothetical protein